MVDILYEVPVYKKGIYTLILCRVYYPARNMHGWMYSVRYGPYNNTPAKNSDVYPLDEQEKASVEGRAKLFELDAKLEEAVARR